MQPSHSKSTPAWNIILDNTSCTTAESPTSVGLGGRFTHGGLKNLRFADVGDHVFDIGEPCVLGGDSADWERDRAASFCFNLKDFGGIVWRKEQRGLLSGWACYAYVILMKLIVTWAFSNLDNINLILITAGFIFLNPSQISSQSHWDAGHYRYS